MATYNAKNVRVSLPDSYWKWFRTEQNAHLLKGFSKGYACEALLNNCYPKGMHLLNPNKSKTQFYYTEFTMFINKLLSIKIKP